MNWLLSISEILATVGKIDRRSKISCSNAAVCVSSHLIGGQIKSNKCSKRTLTDGVLCFPLILKVHKNAG